MDLAQEVNEHRRRADLSGDYEAVDHLWTALVKAAMRYPGSDERVRAKRLIADLDEHELDRVLKDPAIERLATLDPPLEAILYPGEWSKSERVAEALRVLYPSRQNDRQRAAQALAEILKVVRDKRVHGFKSVVGPRDQEILAAARHLLDAFVSVAYDRVAAR